MRILIAHNAYQMKGGEDLIAALETSLLRNFGHQVHFHTVSNDSIKGFWGQVVTGWRTPYSKTALKEIKSIIKETQPDLVHVHNFFPLLSPSIYDACREMKVPVVQTLHNYRAICASGLFIRGGNICEDCIKGTPYQAALYGCYRGSRLGSLFVARMIDLHHRRGTWSQKVNRFIALSEFSKNKFVESGFSSEKIVVKPNFANGGEYKTIVDSDKKGALYVGRLSPEKGVNTLLQAWESMDFPLRVIGDGPLMDILKMKASGNITILGSKKSRQVREEMACATFLVFSSECYENCPLTLIESFMQGLPVIASRMGVMEEMIKDRETGLLFTAGDAKDLAEKVRWAIEHPEEMARMGVNARKVYEQKYTPETNYRQLMTIYQEVTMENEEKKN
jgi:glycosyltransferase involved in cell wall biosynthesis